MQFCQLKIEVPPDVVIVENTSCLKSSDYQDLWNWLITSGYNYPLSAIYQTFLESLPTIQLTIHQWIQSTVENANSEVATWEVARNTEHFNRNSLKCFVHHAILPEAKPGKYFLLCILCTGTNVERPAVRVKRNILARNLMKLLLVPF